VRKQKSDDVAKAKKQPEKSRAQRRAESSSASVKSVEVEANEDIREEAEIDAPESIGEVIGIQETDATPPSKFPTGRDEEVRGAANEPEKGGGKVKLTAYQRKMLKKGKTLQEIEEMQVAKLAEKEVESTSALKEKQQSEENGEDNDKVTEDVGQPISGAIRKKKKLSKCD
jgi:hypothetical protein